MTPQPSKTRMERVYKIPVFGPLARWLAALIRLPESEAYHAHLLEQQERRLRSIEGAPQGPPALMAESARLIEELRAELAKTRVEVNREIEEVRTSIDRWIPELVNRATLHQVALCTLEEASLPAPSRIITQEKNWRVTTEQERSNATAGRSPASGQPGDKELDEVLGELQHHFEARTDALEQSLASWGKQFEGAREFLIDRLEFVRREALFEIRYGRGPGPQNREELITEVLNPEKVERAKESGDLWLNVGCGHLPLDDYINVDFRKLPSVDVVANAADMPFDAGSVSEIRSAHLLEHFPEEQLRREILPYWFSLLRPHGTLRAIVPDAKAMTLGFCDGEISYEDLREVTFGGQDYDGDFHFNMFTPESLRELLQEARFTDVSVPVQGRRNGRCLEFEVIATRPPSEQ